VLLQYTRTIVTSTL